MKIKLNGKEYTVKFGYAPVVKNKLESGQIKLEEKKESVIRENSIYG